MATAVALMVFSFVIIIGLLSGVRPLTALIRGIEASVVSWILGILIGHLFSNSVGER
ncbi:MAG: hypothetical protein ACC630_02185 [Nitrospinota bacterium]